MNRMLASLVVSASFPLSSLPAQVLSGVEPGARIRVTRIAPALSPVWTEGDLTAVDTVLGLLRMRLSGDSLYTVRVAELTAAQVRVGMRRRGGLGLRVGALVGALAGAIWGASAHEERSNNGDFTQGQAAMIGAGLGILIGGSVGGMVGLFIPAPVWEPVELVPQ